MLTTNLPPEVKLMKAWCKKQIEIIGELSSMWNPIVVENRPSEIRGTRKYLEKSKAGIPALEKSYDNFVGPHFVSEKRDDPTFLQNYF